MAGRLRSGWPKEKVIKNTEEEVRKLRQQLAQVTNERNMLAVECLTPRVFMRLVDWLREDPIRPASAAFTAGIERQIAYALEMDVLPEVKRLRIQLENARAGR